MLYRGSLIILLAVYLTTFVWAVNIAYSRIPKDNRGILPQERIELLRLQRDLLYHQIYKINEEINYLRNIEYERDGYA